MSHISHSSHSTACITAVSGGNQEPGTRNQEPGTSEPGLRRYTLGVYAECMDSAKALLGLLGVRASYGYDLKHDYDRLFGARKPLAFGQVYATLARLLRDGKIEPVGDEAGDGPDRKKYAVTGAGRETIREWISTPDVPNESMQSNLFAKTVIAIINGDDAQQILDAQRVAHMARMRDLTRAKLGADIGTTLLADYTLFHIEADLRWIDITTARLGELRMEVTA